MPERVRRSLIAGAALFVVLAALGNIGHTHEHATRLGQTGWMALVIALIPDGLLVLAIVRLRYHLTSIWAWLTVAASAALVAWASIATSTGGTPGQVVALVPLAAAILATGLLHGNGGETREQFTARHEQAVQDARQDAARERAHAADLTAQLDAAQTALDTARAAARDAQQETPTRSASGARTRAQSARRAPARTAPTPDDVQRRRAAREDYQASVRSGDPWPNARLACALTGCTPDCTPTEHRPGPDALKAARKRASDWRAEVARAATDTAREATS